MNAPPQFVFASSSSEDPLKSYNIQQDVKPVVACRGCLVTDQPLRPLDCKLTDAYGLLISPVQQSDIYPKYICIYCCASLQRFTAFRKKCLATQTALAFIHSGGYLITLDVINTNVTKKPYPLQIKPTDNISLDPEYSIPLSNQTNKCKTVHHNIPDSSKNDVLQPRQSDEDIGCKYDIVVEPYSVKDTIQTTNRYDDNRSSNNLDFSNSNNHEVHITNDFVKVEFADSQEENINYESDDNSDFENSDNKDSIEELETETLSSKSKGSSKKQPDRSRPPRGLKKRIINLRNDKIKKLKREKSKAKTISNILNIITDKKNTSKELIEASHTSNSEDNSELNVKDCKTWIKSKTRRKSAKKDKILQYEADKREKLLLDNRKVLEKEFDFKTVVLTKEQQIQQIQERKDSLKYKKARFKCELCYVGFLANETWNKHMAGHELMEGNALCEICSKSVNIKMMTSHIESTHKFDYVCNQCGHISKCLYTAKLHYRWHKGVRYDCKICGKSFDKQTSVMGHMLLAHKDEMLSCSICDHKCNGEKGLRAHINLSHKEAKGAICASCGVQFHSINAMQRHRPKGDCDPTIRPCAACGENFLTDELLEIHKSESHKRTDYVCEICHREFDDKYKYIAHIAYIKHKINKNGNQNEKSKGSGIIRKGKTKTGKQKKNNIMAKESETETKKVKSKRKVYMCEICGSSYTNKTYFDTHCRIHAGEKPFICDYCGKGFASKFFVTRHILLHVGKTTGSPRKVHSCQYCHRQFSFPSNKLRHELTTHRGLVQFSCHICGSTFTTKGAMQNHIRHTHEGVPWPKRVRKV